MQNQQILHEIEIMGYLKQTARFQRSEKLH